MPGLWRLRDAEGEADVIAIRFRVWWHGGQGWQSVTWCRPIGWTQ